jgi:hypothetical protein
VDAENPSLMMAMMLTRPDSLTRKTTSAFPVSTYCAIETAHRRAVSGAPVRERQRDAVEGRGQRLNAQGIVSGSANCDDIFGIDGECQVKLACHLFMVKG